MQAHPISASGNPASSPHLSDAKAIDALQDQPEAISSSAATTPEAEQPSALDQSLTTLRETLDEHKGKLAISAAAMLGLLVYYKWGEKSLAKEDPEEYERLQRIKEGVRHADDRRRSQRRSSDAVSTPERK